MLTELESANEKIISIMKENEIVLGSWYFGSVSRGISDEYSDIDIVFLAENDGFENLSNELTDLIAPVVDKVVMCWAEDFNSEKIKNYDLLLMSNGKIFQYDIFLLNKKYIGDFMCRLHYAGLSEENVIFDKTDDVKRLAGAAPEGSRWSADIGRLIETYWLHVHMSAKYFLRKDFFKLEGVLRILMDTHASLLLAGLDETNWGGAANKLHFISPEKQSHLMKYGCTGDFRLVRNNLLQSIAWFEEDAEEIGTPENRRRSGELGKLVKEYWVKNTEKIL